MLSAHIEHDGGNIGNLFITTYFGNKYVIPINKESNQIFRLGGTAVDSICSYEGIILDIDQSEATFRAYRNLDHFFEVKAVLAPQGFQKHEHGYISEYYELDMEGNSPKWLITREPVKDNLIFINVDILDGGHNIINRYRISPFFGNYKIIHGIN